MQHVGRTRTCLYRNETKKNCCSVIYDLLFAQNCRREFTIFWYTILIGNLLSTLRTELLASSMFRILFDYPGRPVRNGGSWVPVSTASFYLQPYRTFNFDVLGGYIWKGVVIICTKHTPRQALLIKSKISHSAFNERTVRDPFGIVVITGHPVCKMDPPMAGGGLQLVCVNIVGAGKSVHEGNLLGKCNSVSGEQNRLVHWYFLYMEVVSPRGMILALLKPTMFSPSEPCMFCEAGECLQ
jgi:hypothetical protein